MTPDEEHSVDGEAPSLRDSLSEAFEAARGDGAGGADGASAAPGPDSEEAPGSTPAASRADSRDANGRFAARAESNPSRTPAAPEAHNAGSSGEAQPIQPPASWSAPAKAAFSTLPPIVQQEIAKREADVSRGFEDRAAALKRYEPLEQILQPRREMLAARGVSDVDFVKTLFAASDWIDRDPVSALRELMRQKGVTLQHLGVQAQPGQQPPHAAQLPPAVRTLAQQVQHLQTQLSQRDQAERAQRLQSFKSEIDAFAADPANTYFHNVCEDMIGLLQSGRASELKDAYDKAVWANPETRALLQAEQARRAEADRLNAQRQAARGARRAAGSVVGAPTLGASPAGAGSIHRSLRDELSDAFRSSRA